MEDHKTQISWFNELELGYTYSFIASWGRYNVVWIAAIASSLYTTDIMKNGETIHNMMNRVYSIL